MERFGAKGQQVARILLRLPGWVAALVIVLVVFLTASWFLWPDPVEFPMDDTYIHFTYAQNLVRYGRLMFNFPDEVGVGTSSPLWVWLLALGSRLGLSMYLVAKVLGLLTLIALGLGITMLLAPGWGRRQALLCALLVVSSGNVLWFALSGMETVLFLALGFLGLNLYRAERWVWLGVVLGLMVLTRTDGAALALAIGGVELLRCRRLHRGILAAGMVCVGVAAPWFLYLQLRTGYLLPTSAIGKSLSTEVALRHVVQRNADLAMFVHFPATVYLVTWVVYLMMFALGGMSFPAPRLPVGVVVGNPNYYLSLWAIVLWVGVILPVLAAGVGGLKPSGGLRRWVDHARWRVIVVLLLWVLIHNLAYMLVLPIPGTASRYGAINHVLLWLVLGFGLGLLIKKGVSIPWFAGGMLLLVFTNLVYWNGVYDANLEHMRLVRIAAGRYIREAIPAQELCAAFDVGAIRYFGQRPILDLGGLVDPYLGERFLRGELDDYLVEKGASCLLLPGRAGTNREGWFDFAELMGLKHSPLFSLQQVRVFEISYERWLQGYLPTNNYQESVTVYRLVR